MLSDNPIYVGYFYILFYMGEGGHLLPLCSFLSRDCTTKIFGWRCWSGPNFFNHKLGCWPHPSSWWRHVFSEKNFFYLLLR